MSSTEIIIASIGSRTREMPDTTKPFRELSSDGTAAGVDMDSTSSMGRDIELRSPWRESWGGRLQGKFELLQLWEGYVISVFDGKMRCRLVDKTDEDNPDEEVVVSLNDIQESDLHLVVPGAIFYWSIRYADHGRGREKASLFRFRRLPAINKRVVEAAKRRAQYLEEIFSIDE